MSWIAPSPVHWNESFCDEQEAGPFAYWKHCHRPRRHTKRNTQAPYYRDVEYALPFGPLGNIANSIFAPHAMLRSTFAYRHQATILWLDRLAAKYRTAPIPAASPKKAL